MPTVLTEVVPFDTTQCAASSAVQEHPTEAAASDNNTQTVQRQRQMAGQDAVHCTHTERCLTSSPSPSYLPSYQSNT
jgi:hypothetical protein